MQKRGYEAVKDDVKSNNLKMRIGGTSDADWQFINVDDPRLMFANLMPTETKPTKPETETVNTIGDYFPPTATEKYQQGWRHRSRYHESGWEQLR